MTNQCMFAVNFWGSHPDAGNDDCWTGKDFATEAEARICFDATPEADTEYVELCVTGPGACEGCAVCRTEVYQVRINPYFRKRARSHDREARNEAVMQAGMMGGCDALNDESERWG